MAAPVRADFAHDTSVSARTSGQITMSGINEGDLLIAFGVCEGDEGGSFHKKD